jgi:hypothetical protein
MDRVRFLRVDIQSKVPERPEDRNGDKEDQGAQVVGAGKIGGEDVDFCKECAKRSLCAELCPEAEAYVNQDFVKQKELTIGLPTYKNLPTDLHYKTKRKLLNNFDKLSRKEQVVTLLNSGMSRKEIAQTLEITRENVRKLIQRYRKDVTLSSKGKGEVTQGQETKESDQKSE